MACASERGGGAAVAQRWWLEIAHQASAGAWAGAFASEGWRAGVWAAPGTSSALDAQHGDDPVAAFAALLEMVGAAEEAVGLTFREREGCRLGLWRRGSAPDPLWIRAGRANPIAEPLGIAQVDLESGDYMVSVSGGYLRATGLDVEQLAVAVGRWVETGTDAAQLRDCLSRTGQRLAQSRQSSLEGMAILTARLRPLVSATIWTGPPSDQDQDRVMLELLMAERGARLICGDTTAKIASRLLGKELRLDRREMAQAAARDEAALSVAVPPSADLEGIDLVTEGVVTMRRAAEWLRGAGSIRGLPRNVDAATRLARLLWGADELRFLVGKALNPAQASSEESAPMRLAVVDELAASLRALGKVVVIRYF